MDRSPYLFYFATATSRNDITSHFTQVSVSSAYFTIEGFCQPAYIGVSNAMMSGTVSCVNVDKLTQTTGTTYLTRSSTSGISYLTRSSTYSTIYLTRSSTSGYSGKSSSSKEISSWL